MEITAAHEMLHAAYQELSASEQASLNQKLRVAFQNLRNRRLIKLLKIYEQQDPSVLDNELHSILGTEVAGLGADLEKHYQQYFSDRSAVVAFSQRYEQTFTKLTEQADQIDRQLAAMKPQLEQLKQQAREQGQSIEQQRSELGRLVAANQQDLHNAKLPGFNQQVNSYNQLVNEIKQQTGIYNQLVNSYNSLSLEEKSLNNALTSSTPESSRP
jgi:chromosome segregation ATPase